jgi:hypothetical protein
MESKYLGVCYLEVPYSFSTERTYIHWIKHYIFFHNKKHPIEMAKVEIEAFLTYLAVERKSHPQRKTKPFLHYCFYIKK